jgi:uncharacterized membrane protein YfhO
VTSCLLFVVIIEVILQNYSVVNSRRFFTESDISGGSHFGDGTQEAVGFIKDYAPMEKNFYRIGRDYHSTHLSDALYFGYNGFESYLSVNQPHYFNFLKENSIPIRLSSYINWVDYAPGRDVLRELLGERFYLSKTIESKPNYNLVAKISGISIFENTAPIPVGFVYHKYISESQFKSIEGINKDRVYLHAAVLAETSVSENLENLNIDEAILNTSERSGEDKDSSVTTVIKAGEKKIDLKIATDKDGIVFFSIPYDKCWSVKINNKITNTFKVNFGFLGSQISAGENHIILEYSPLNMEKYLVVSFLFFLLFLVSIQFDNRKQYLFRSKTIVS